MSGAPKADPRPSALRVRLDRVADWSHGVAERGHYIAAESDRWFVTALHGLDRRMTRARSGVAEAGHQVMVRSKRWFSTIRRDVSASERIRQAILREAGRQGFQADQLEQFSENIGLVVEMVISGAVKVEDIAFEQAATDEPAAGTEPCAAPPDNEQREAPADPVSETPPASDQFRRGR